ncbi:MAG TPA: SCO family protein [Thiotrichaceae bacterium]|nr:SCO family protein [Thiotrichaceae bacterium]
MKIQPVLKSGLAILLGACILFKVNGVFAAPPYGVLSSETTIDPALMQIDESKYLGARLIETYQLMDVNGQEFTLADMMGKPLILLFSYYGCDGTCPTLNINLKQVVNQMTRFQIGEDYRVLTVSFDKHDTQEIMSEFVETTGISTTDMREGWRHAILKHKETDVDKLTASLGYNYFWSRTDQVFLHPNVLILITPEGRVARYLYGTAVDKDTLELALIDADWNRIANSTRVIDILAGVCYSYNFQDGQYTLNYSLFVGLGSLFFGISLVGFSIFIFHFKRKKLRRLSHV